MALTPWNRQEEWYQEMINASTGNYLPSITAQDEGKVLTVESDGSWGVENVPSELPAVTASDKDKFLHTNESTGALEWAEGGSGGGDIEIVKFVIDADNENATTCDHTFSQLEAARTAGKDMFALIDLVSEESATQSFACALTYNDYGEGDVAFYASHSSVRSSLSGGIDVNSVSVRVDTDGVYGEASQSTASSTMAVLENSKTLTSSYAIIKQAINTGKYVTVYTQSGSFPNVVKQVKGILINAQDVPENNIYRIYGLYLDSGTFTTLYWESSTADGNPIRS